MKKRGFTKKKYLVKITKIIEMLDSPKHINIIMCQSPRTIINDLVYVESHHFYECNDNSSNVSIPMDVLPQPMLHQHMISLQSFD